MRLLLFDIDGTLLSCGPQVGPIFLSALAETYGRPGCREPGYSFAGKVDPGIVLDLMRAAGMDEEEVLSGLETMRERYARRLEADLRASKMRLLPGVRELLDALHARQELWMGLLTGNWEVGARTKLGRFDLNRYFSFGGFGDDGIQRGDLVPPALERARRAAGRDFLPEEVLVIGDTPHDVACAHAHGLRVLAVATGTIPAEELEAAGADWVAKDLLEAATMIPVLAAG